MFYSFEMKEHFRKNECLKMKSLNNPLNCHVYFKGKIALTQTLCFPAASDWVVAQEELTAANRYCIQKLTTGDLLHVRVVAVNPGGRSEPGALAEPVPIREIVGK